MAVSKKYTDASYYETKLDKVMSRFGIVESDYTYNWDRFSSHIQFKYRGEMYRFELSTKKADDLSYGSDCFARLVLSLEDLSRMVERGIYDLSTWVAGISKTYHPDQGGSSEQFTTLQDNAVRAKEYLKERE